MADLFDALAARALGTAPALAPVLSARFAPTAAEPDVEDQGPADPAATSRTEQAPPVVRSTPEPALIRPRQEASPAGDDLAPVAGVPAPQPANRVLRPPAGGLPQPPVAGPPDDRAQQRAPARSRPAGPPPSHRPDMPTEPVRRRSPAAPVEVDGRPGPERSPGRPEAEADATGEPIGATPAVGQAAPADVVDVAPASHHAPLVAPVQVSVSIGSVEVRAPARPPSPVPPPRRPQPRLSLQDYLHRDGRGRR